MITIEVIEEGDFFLLRRGDEIIRYCGCCGKQFNAAAAGVIVQKLLKGELDWKIMYQAGRSWST